MAEEIEYAIREAYSMNLSFSQKIRFVMKMASVDRRTAEKALHRYMNKVSMAH